MTHALTHYASAAALEVSNLKRHIVQTSDTDCRTLDPILGIFTGVFAYYLHEMHPRTVLPEELRLMSLLRWKRETWQQEREHKLQATEESIDWQAIAASVEGVGDRNPKK